MKDPLLIVGWLASDGIPPGLLKEKARDRLEPAADGTLTASPDLQERLREEHGAAGREAAIRAMHDYLRSGGRAGRTARCLELLPHVNAWIARTAPEDDFPEALNLLGEAVILLLENEMGAAAVPIAERVTRSAQLHVGDDNPKTLTARANLASAYDKAGDPRRGARLLEKVTERRAALLGDDHPDVWHGVNNLAAIHMRAGEYDRATALAEKIVAYRTRTAGEHHHDTLLARSNLAVVLNSAGRSSQARAMWEELLPLFEQYVGPGHPDTVIVRVSLQRADGEGDQESEALAEVEERIALLDRSQDTWARLATRLERATLLRDHDRLEEAMAAFADAMEEGSALLGRGHPIMVSAGYRLAYAQLKAGRTDLALATVREALAEADRTLGRTHDETLLTAAFLLSVLFTDNRLEEHQALLEDRLADIVEGLGFAHPLVRALAVHRARLHLRLS